MISSDFIYPVPTVLEYLVKNFILVFAVRAKRPECSFKSNFKMPLIELEKLTRSKKTTSNNNIPTSTKRERLKSVLRSLARFLFALVLLAVLAAVMAKLYVSYRNRRLVSLSNEGYVPK